MHVLKEISTDEEFADLEPIWMSFLDKIGCQSPFFTHHWYQSCLTYYGGGKRLFTLVVSEDDDIIALAPLWIYSDSVRGIKVRKIGFISCPETPYADLILSKEGKEQALLSIMKYLYVERGGEWDVGALDQWPEESANLIQFQKLLQKQKRRYDRCLSSVSPYIQIKGDWQDFIGSHSTRFRKTRRNINNRIKKLGQVKVNQFRTDIAGDVFNEIIQVSKKSWKYNKGVAISNDENRTNFFKHLTELSSNMGWLQVWTLSIDGNTIATEYDLEYNAKVHALRADFDEDYRKFSPGAFLEYQIIKRLFKKRYEEYSFGPGLNNYKIRWTDNTRQNMELHLFNNSLRGFIAWGMENGAIPVLRKLKHLKEIVFRPCKK